MLSRGSTAGNGFCCTGRCSERTPGARSTSGPPWTCSRDQSGRPRHARPAGRFVDAGAAESGRAGDRRVGHPALDDGVAAVRGVPTLREKLVGCIARQKAKARRCLSLPVSTYSAPGGLRQDPGGGAKSSAEATACGNGGTTCVCCRRMGGAVTSNRWWDRQFGRERSGRWCGGARRPTGRSGRATRPREGGQRRGRARREVRRSRWRR